MGRRHAYDRGRLAFPRKRQARVQLERLEPRELLATFVVTDTGDGTPGSLRQAITLSNSNPGPNVIQFQIKGTGPFVIQPRSALPGIFQPVLIDGTSEPGYQGTPLVEIDGTTATNPNGATTDGLQFFAGNSQVQGLAIEHFSGSGITNFSSTPITIGGTAAGAGNVIGGNALNGILIGGSGSTGNLVAGNLIGFDISGTTLGNQGHGVLIQNGGGNTVGGTTAAARNVISANGMSGVALLSSVDILKPLSNNVVVGNFIGTNAAGNAVAGNSAAGVLLGGRADSNTIGGTSPGAANVIGGNAVGVAVLGSGVSTNQVIGNFIGTDLTGRISLANQQNGVLFANSSANSVGGTTQADANTIAFNGQSGVQVNGGTADAILGNSIFSNNAGGISLLNQGNLNQPAPVLTADQSDPTSTSIQGTLQAAPSLTFRVEFFSDAGDPSGFGQGKTFLGFANVTTDATGAGSFSVVLPVVVNPGLVLSATATDPEGNTSAFSRDLPVVVSFTVINTNDSGSGSLRNAILNANRIAGRNLIDFDIPGTGPFTIAPLTPLPAITEAVNLDATTQPGFAGKPIVDLSGASMTSAAADGLVVNAGSLIRGLAIGQFPGAGIHLIGGGGSIIEGDYLGTNVTGTAKAGNESAGIAIENSPNNTVGGTTAGSRDVISGNQSVGVLISGSASRGNSVQGSFIGTDVTGTVDLGNSGSGVFITDAPNNTVGGLTVGAGNIIAGTSAALIQIAGAGSTGNLIVGNRIGTDPTGTTTVGRAQVGVFIQGSAGNGVGSAAAGGGNIISGSQVGVELYTAGTSNNLILGNRIGTNAAGTSALGNDVGVFLYDAAGNQVGGPDAGDGNLISGNTAIGVRLFGSGAHTNNIQGNLIGTNAAGNAALGNGDDGILIGSPGNLIGGLTAGARNIVSGNGFVGIQLLGPQASGNVIQGNYVGLDITGTRAIPNGVDGIYLNGVQNNSIGGTASGAGNVVSGNRSSAIQIFGAGTTGNVIQGNRVGFNAAGTAAIGNGYGIFLNTTSPNTIGGNGAGQSNDLRGNLFSNVFAIPGSLAPTVQSFQLQTSGQAITALVLTFSNDMNLARVQQLRNYRVQLVGTRGAPGSTVKLVSAVFNPIQRTVTLTPAQPLSLTSTYNLTVNGTAPRGLANVNGVLLDGTANGRTGTNYFIRFGQGTAITSGNPVGTRSAIGSPGRPTGHVTRSSPRGPRRHVR